MPRDFTQIGSTSDCFFWCLKEFEGKLYIGSYGTPKIYNYPPWNLQIDLDAGESVCDLKPLSNKLYACTENKGYIYRMDSPSVWPRVHDDAYPWALGLGTMESYIYCALADSPWTGEAKIIRSSNGTSWSQVKIWSGGWFFILYGGYLYNLGAVEDEGIWSRAIRSSDGATWNAVAELAGINGAWNPALVKDGFLYMALGERSDGKTKIYKYNGSDTPSEVLSVTAFRAYGFNNVAILNDEMYFLFGPDMNSGSAGSVTYYLYKSPTGASGDWTLVKTFNDNRKLSHGKYRTQGCVGTFENALYVGIQDKLYRMTEPKPVMFI